MREAVEVKDKGTTTVRELRNILRGRDPNSMVEIGVNGRVFNNFRVLPTYDDGTRTMIEVDTNETS